MPEPHHSPAAPPIVIRRWRREEPVSEITRLLHRAYAAQVAMGLRPLAGRQDDATTRARFETGEAYLAVEPGPRAGETIVGCILFEEREEAAFPEWFLRPEVAHYSLFAVDPARQGQGIGRMLLEAIEARAIELGFKHLSLSMAEPDAPLLRFYLNRGYSVIEYWQWPYTNYRSVILSRPIGG